MYNPPPHSPKLLRIAERDGWVCWICQQPVDSNRFRGRQPSKRGRHGKAPTLDHIVPKSLGGSDGDHNLKLAHDSCNRKRQQGTPGESALVLDPRYRQKKPKRNWNQ